MFQRLDTVLGVYRRRRFPTRRGELGAQPRQDLGVAKDVEDDQPHDTCYCLESGACYGSDIVKYSTELLVRRGELRVDDLVNDGSGRLVVWRRRGGMYEEVLGVCFALLSPNDSALIDLFDTSLDDRATWR